MDNATAMNPRAATFLLDLYLGGRIQFKNLVEFTLLMTERKSVIRLVGQADLLDDMKALGDMLGVSVAKSPFMLNTVRTTSSGDRFQVSVPWSSDSNMEFVIYIGRDKAVASAVGIEAGDCTATDTADVYGYPACCGRNYPLISEGQNWVAALLKNSTGTWHDYRANKIASLFDPCLTLHQDYFPCSLDCAESLHRCHAAERALAESGLEEMLPFIKKHLSGVYLLSDDILWFAREFRYEAATGRFDAFQSIGSIDISGRGRRVPPPISIELCGERLRVFSGESTKESVNGESGTKLVIFK